MTMEFEKKTHRKRRWGKTIEWGSYERRIITGSELDEFVKEVKETVTKNPVTTPQDLATKFDIRVSVAKDLLKMLEEEGIVERVISSSRLKAYKPI